MLPAHEAVLFSCRLGGLVYEARSHDGVVALKLCSTEIAFRNELQAYKKLLNEPTLHDNVPTLKCAYERVYDQRARLHHYAIGISLVRGTTLKKIIDTLPSSQRSQLYKTLEKILKSLHLAGIFHCNIREENVIINNNLIYLFNFSRASFKEAIPPRLWERCQKCDLTELKFIFAEADARSATRSAFAVLTPTINSSTSQQEALARLLDTSSLSLARAIYSVVSTSAAAGYIETFLSHRADRSCSQAEEGDQRNLLDLKILLARCHSVTAHENSVTIWQETINNCTELLGATDINTLQVQYEYAQHLFHKHKHQHAAATEVCLNVLDTIVRVAAEEAQASRTGYGFDALQQKTLEVSILVKGVINLTQKLLAKVDDDLIQRRAKQVLEHAYDAMNGSEVALLHSLETQMFISKSCAGVEGKTSQD